MPDQGDSTFPDGLVVEGKSYRVLVDSKEFYIGVPVPNPRVRLPEKNLRSRNEYHITLISPDELRNLLDRKGWTIEKAKEDLDGYEFETEPQYSCMGKQEKGENAVYYIVVRWPEAQEFRKLYGFDKTDLHVTLGFRTADIHDVPKNSSTCIGKLGEDMDRLEELVQQLKEAVHTRDVAEVLGVEEYDLEYDAQEASVKGHALINVLVTGNDGLKGKLNWADVESASSGILRSLEYQVMGMLQDRVNQEPNVELPDGSEYTPDWEAHGSIAWPQQNPFRIKNGETNEIEVEVEYKDEVG